MSATPTIPAQSVAGAAQDVPEAQAALRANKEVFFFRLVGIRAGIGRGDILIDRTIQEREIEKVNAFYLQKEAEVR